MATALDMEPGVTMDEAETQTERPPERSDPLGERSVLLALSYRLLGSLADAEDAVQETYIRWYRLSEEQRRLVSSPRAWLITTASRIGLDMLSTARARRERYVGPWLPEPVPGMERWSSQDTSTGVDPAERAALGDSVSMALMVVLESMTPAERVAFVLHDVFSYTFAEIADIVGRTPAACRQLASSGRRRVRAERRGLVDPAMHSAVVRSFKTAWETGDLTGLVGLLDPDAIAIIDGGGLVSAALEPLVGAEAVAEFLLGVYERQPDLVIRQDQVNGELGLVASGGGRVLAIVSVAQVAGRIERVWAVRNPDKLHARGRVWTTRHGSPPLESPTQRPTGTAV